MSAWWWYALALLAIAALISVGNAIARAIAGLSDAIEEGRASALVTIEMVHKSEEKAGP